MIDIILLLHILLLTLILRDIGRYIGESIKRGFEKIVLNNNIDFSKGFIDGIEKMQTKVDYRNINRFEVIDHRDGDKAGRRMVEFGEMDIDVSIQDNGETLKVFISDKNND